MGIGCVHIGTSGYTYPHWRGKFYPANLPPNQWLTFYANHFDTVEINYSFYHLPRPSTLLNWKSKVDKRFTFILKANKQITHHKKLVGVEDSLPRFLEAARNLGNNLGPILFQLPPSLHFDLPRLQDFLSLLPNDLKFALEVRHNSWNTLSTFELLERYKVAYCIISAPRLETRLEITAPFSYIRFHGIDQWYSYNYTEEDLRWWAEQIGKIRSKCEEVYAFFNNDYGGYALDNARRLKELLISD